MKTFTKLLLVLFIGLISFTTTAQTEEVIPITETERIIDKYGGKITESFNNMVENVTPYAEEGFNMVVKLQIAKGIILLLPLIMLIICIIIFKNEYFRINKILSSDNIPNHFNEGYGPFCDSNGTPILYATFISLILLCIISLFTTYDSILYLMAPEWFAIKEILNLI